MSRRRGRAAIGENVLRRIRRNGSLSQARGDRQRRGTLDTSNATVLIYEYTKYLSSVHVQDQLCTQLVLRAVLDASGVPSPAELAPPETTYGKALFGAALDDLYAGRAKKVVFARKGSGELESVSDVQLPKGIIVYSGSFNPLHKV